MIVPVTRKEKLLNAIATSGNVDFSPKTREELFLFKILGADVNTPTPITRKELLYQHVADGTIPTFEPRTRLEKFIMAAAGVELELPVVLTREEYWWAEISDSAYETITGAIVHFISKRARAVKSLIANISYTQDLHGYSYPWPAGGGKNKFNGTFLQGYWAYADGGWVNGNGWITTEKIPCKPSTYYTVSADEKITRWQGFVWYDSNGNFISTDNLQSNVNIGLTKTSPSNAAYLIFNIAGYPNSTDTIAPSDVTHLQIEEGQTATAYSPYSNICPISGYNNVAVKKAQRNIWAFEASYNPAGYAVLVPRNTEFYLPAGTYTFSAIPDIESSSVVLGGYYADDTQVALARLNASEERQSATFTIAKPLYKMYLITNKGGTISDIQLEVDSTASSYEPYSGDTYSITFPAAAGTVYSGTLDIVSGLLTINRTTVNTTWGSGINATNLGYVTRKRFNLDNPSKKYYTDAQNDLKSNVIGQYDTLYSGDYVHMYLASTMYIWAYMPSNTAADTVMQFSYTLETPVIYQLTPTEVTTLLGDNTIWADTGDVSVTY